MADPRTVTAKPSILWGKYSKSKKYTQDDGYDDTYDYEELISSQF